MEAQQQHGNATVQGASRGAHNEGGGVTVRGAGSSTEGAGVTKEGGSVTMGGSLVRMGAQALQRELRRSMLPLLFGITGAGEGGRVHPGHTWAAGAGAGAGERAREGERKPWQGEVVRKIEKWSHRPSSLCFGHGNVTIVTVTVGLPQVCTTQHCAAALHNGSMHNSNVASMRVGLHQSKLEGMLSRS